MISALTKYLSEQIPDFTKLEVVNKGGFKIVFKLHTSKSVEALKLIRCSIEGAEGFETSKEHLQRARLEVKSLSSLNHENIVKIGSIPSFTFKHNNQHWLGYSEEFLKGYSLREWINATQLPTISNIKLLLSSIVAAIEYLNINGFYHRDIKPENIIYIPDPTPRFILIDFGTILDTNSTLSITVATPPRTLHYTAPELLGADYKKHLTYRSDLYSLAITVFEFACKRFPFNTKRSDLLIEDIQNKELPRLSTMRKDIPVEIDFLISQLAKKNPLNRISRFSYIKNLISGGV